MACLLRLKVGGILVLAASKRGTDRWGMTSLTLMESCILPLMDGKARLLDVDLGDIYMHQFMVTRTA